MFQQASASVTATAIAKAFTSATTSVSEGCNGGSRAYSSANAQAFATAVAQATAQAVARASNDFSEAESKSFASALEVRSTVSLLQASASSHFLLKLVCVWCRVKSSLLHPQQFLNQEELAQMPFHILLEKLLQRLLPRPLLMPLQRFIASKLPSLRI